MKTPKGTELPVLNLRGKDYLEVKWRLVWFREEHPDWGIQTEVSARGNDWACIKATVTNPNGIVMAQSHKTEDAKGFPDFLEKAETGAIGRALALCGYGTQFCADELDEGKRIVDSPVQKQETEPAIQPNSDEIVISFGMYKGATVRQAVDRDGLPAIQKYVGWLVEESKKIKPGKAKPTGLSDDAKKLIEAVEVYQRGLA